MAVMIKNNEVKIFPGSQDLFQFAANDFRQRAIAAINQKGEFSIVLSGGNTPKSFFDVLTTDYYKTSIPWQEIKFFFGDERYVPANSEESNFHMANKYLFDKVPVNPENIYRIRTEFDNANDAANAYEQLLRKTFHIHDKAFPPFDLVYLGLGDNAHTASLMPLSDVVMQYIKPSSADINTQLVASLFMKEKNMYRITLTPPAINNGKNIIFLVDGANKATAIWEVLQGKTDPLHYPAQLIHSVHGKTYWYLDQAAAQKLNF